MPKKKIKCESCGTEAVALRPTRRFCSNTCAARNHYRAKLKRKTIDGRLDKCSGCSNQIWWFPRNIVKGRHYCSRQCFGATLIGNSPLNCVVCSEEFYCSKSQVKYRARKTCSMICTGRLRTLRAEQDRLDNPPTRGALNRRIRYSKKMDDWRESVFKRDNYTCQDCGARNGNGKKIYLQAHHIKPFALFEDLRFDITNGETLCKPCHKKTSTYGYKKEIYLSA